MGFHATLISLSSRAKDLCHRIDGLFLAYDPWICQHKLGMPNLQFVNFLSLSFGAAARVSMACPVVSSVAKVTDVHIIKGWLNSSRLKAKEEEANCYSKHIEWQTDLASYWVGALRCETMSVFMRIPDCWLLCI